MLKLFISIITTVSLALIMSFGVDYFYRQVNNLPYNPPQNIFPLPEIAEKYKIVALGNSHAESGLIFDEYNTKTKSLASVSQSFEYDLALLKMNSRQIDKGAIIIITVSPISFSQMKPKKDELVNMNYYDGRLSPYLIPYLKVSEYLQIQIAPFVRSGYLWRQEHAKKVALAVDQSYAASRGEKLTPDPIDTSQFRPTDPPYTSLTVEEIKKELDAPASPMLDWMSRSADLTADKWYNSGGFSKSSFRKNREDLEDIISYSIDHHWRPILITFPINQVLLNTLEKDYLKHYIYDNLDQTDLHRTPYFNFANDPRLTKNAYIFTNSDHLNSKGAAVISYLLLQKLIENKYLTKSVDKYLNLRPYSTRTY